MKLRAWYAVHGRLDVVPSPTAILDSIRPRVADLIEDFELVGDVWEQGVLKLPNDPNPLVIMRREASVNELPLCLRDGWEAELRSWPGPNCDYVIEFLRNRRQWLTVMPISGSVGPTTCARICEQVCGYLGRTTDGLIHVFQEGFFNLQGESIFPQNPRHKLKTT